MQSQTHGAVLILQSFTSNASGKHAHSIVSPTKVKTSGTRLFVVVVACRSIRSTFIMQCQRRSPCNSDISCRIGNGTVAKSSEICTGIHLPDMWKYSKVWLGWFPRLLILESGIWENEFIQLQTISRFSPVRSFLNVRNMYHGPRLDTILFELAPHHH